MITSVDKKFIQKIIFEAEPRFAKAINWLEEESGKLFGTNGNGKFEALAYINRPGARIIKGCINGKNLYIKISKNLKNDKKSVEKSLGKYQAEFEVLKQLKAQLATYSQFNVVEPLAFLREFHALITYEGGGENFHEVILSHAPVWKGRKYYNALCEYAANCGKWLKVFQSTDAGNTPEYVSLDDLIEYADIRLKNLVADNDRMFPESLRQKVLEYYSAMLPVLKTEPMIQSIAHGDFCPVNALVAEDSVTILDFPMLRKAPIFQDVVRFIMQLDNLKYKKIYPNTIIKQMQNEFIQGYDAELKLDSPQIRLMILQQILTHFWGLRKWREKRFYSRMYSQMICRQHVQEIEDLIRS